MEISRAKIISNCKPGDVLIHRRSHQELIVLDFKVNWDGSYYVCKDKACNIPSNPIILFPVSLPHFDILKLS